MTTLPRTFLLLALLVALPLAACKGGGGSGGAGATPTPSAERERIYLQIDVAVAGEVELAELLEGRLAAGPTLGGGVRWRPVPATLPKLAAVAPAVTADVYEDPGWVSIAFRGAMNASQGAAAPEISSLLAGLASRPQARGAGAYLLDDAEGTVAGVLAVAGRDGAEAAMALLDLWAPQLELSYAPEGLAEEGDVDRSRVTEALRVIDAERELVLATGARLSREDGATVVTFAPGSDTRALAISLSSRVATTGASPANAAAAATGTAGAATSTRGAP